MTDRNVEGEALARFYRQSVEEDQQADVPFQAEAGGVARSADERLHDAEVARVEQANELRDKFFRGGMSVLGLTVLVSSICVLILTCRGTISDAVLLAFIGGVTVDVIAVIAIMAKYLFAASDSDKT